MYCPFCAAEETKVIDSRLMVDVPRVKRRRECQRCKERFTTFESPVLEMPRIVKRDNRRCAFEEEKLRVGFLKALEKRPVSATQVESAIGHILQRLRASGEREIHSDRLGQFVMDELRLLDQVAYVRFASVYRRFEDIDAFRDEVDRLKKK